MPSFYSVVQYVPDPVADERMNVGVIVLGEHGTVKARFVQNWARAQQFGHRPIHFLKDFASSISDGLQMPLKGIGKEALNQEILKRMSADWRNSIQITEPRASLKVQDALLAETIQLFLKEPGREVAPKHAVSHGRKVAARFVVREVQLVLKERFSRSEARELLKKDHPLAGKLGTHQLDVTVGNGVPVLAAHGLSFGVKHESELADDIDSTAWKVSDIKKEMRSLPIAIVAVGDAPKEVGLFKQAQKIFKSLKTDLLEPEKFQRWAARETARIHHA